METVDIDALIVEVGERHKQADGMVDTKAAKADLAPCLAKLPAEQLIQWILGKCVIKPGASVFALANMHPALRMLLDNPRFEVVAQDGEYDFSKMTASDDDRELPF